MKNLSHRIVHFDLKGAPWKVHYLKEVIAAAKQWGATGIIFEWEDSFPYTAPLISIGSLGGSSRDFLYSNDEIKQILQFTADQGLDAIQLVQTLGHLEFVLKHEEFAHLRELRFYPSVLCPTRNGAKELVVGMVHQALAMQPDAKFIHIGADEAWHFNKCHECILKSSRFGVDSLFLDHIRMIVMEIKKLFPKVQVLIWDDMMREIQEASLLAAEMSKFVIPVVWHYGPVGAFNLNMNMWLKYDKCFGEVWAASAFKGANGSCQMLSSVEHYVSNQEAWLQQIQQLNERSLHFTGVILTGWSRYDHYATLCELLPVSLPSLASCLKMWTKADNVPTDAVLRATLPAAEWAGAQCARSVRELHATRERTQAFLNGDMVSTWMNPWQLANGYTTAMQLMPIGNTARLLDQELNVIVAELSDHLHALTGPRSADEWLRSNIEATSTAVRRLVQQATDRAQRPASIVPIASDINSVPES